MSRRDWCSVRVDGGIIGFCMAQSVGRVRVMATAVSNLPTPMDCGENWFLIGRYP